MSQNTQRMQVLETEHTRREAVELTYTSKSQNQYGAVVLMQRLNVLATLDLDLVLPLMAKLDISGDTAQALCFITVGEFVVIVHSVAVDSIYLSSGVIK